MEANTEERVLSNCTLHATLLIFLPKKTLEVPI